MRIAATAAKAKWSLMLDHVVKGDVVRITLRGKVVAVLIRPEWAPPEVQEIDGAAPIRPAGETSPAPAHVGQPKPTAPASAPGLTLAEIIAASA